MLIIPASAFIAALTVFVIARMQDSRSAAPRAESAHHTPAE
jgi:hypothetical protein